MKTIITLLLMVNITCHAQERPENSIQKNGMMVTWYFQNDRIYLEMSAPTEGWVAIGFNDRLGIKGTYLLMGRIVGETAEVVEYYTVAPGDYRPIKTLGENPQVKEVRGVESNGKSILAFSLPTKSMGQYQRDLSEGLKYHLILAYSTEDDFQHHSRMRTSVNVQL